jgi:uncharacterized protein YkwD
MAGENLGYGYSEPKKVIAAWYKSRSHRRIMLNQDMQLTGASCYIAANGVLWWTQHYGVILPP